MTDTERRALVDRVAAVIEARLRLYLDEANAAPETEQKLAKAIVEMLFPRTGGPEKDAAEEESAG